MAEIQLRKSQIILEDQWHDGGTPLPRPIKRGVVFAVINNPFAGRYEPDLVPFMQSLQPLATSMARDLLKHLGGDPSAIESYGKGAIVGVNGEIENAAIWHSPGGAGLREALGDGKAPVPGNQKMGVAGTTLDIAMGNVDAAYVRSHYDAISVMISDAPRPNELVLALAFGLGGRVHPRLGGTTAAEARAITGRP